MFNERAKTSEVSLQGTIHAIVPVTDVSPLGTTPDIREGEAKKRLDRAFTEIGEKYGIRLTFRPDEPNDYTLRAEDIKQYVVSTGTDPIISPPHNPKSVHFPHGTDPEAMEKAPAELPKCIETDEYKKRVLNLLNEYGNYHGDTGLWLHIIRGESNANRIVYEALCPFCDCGLHRIELLPSVNAAQIIMQQRMVDFPAPCPKCDIRFTWDFTKNTVKMEKMGGGEEEKAKPGCDYKALKTAIEALNGVEKCKVDFYAGFLAVDIELAEIPMKYTNARGKAIAETMYEHMPPGEHTYGQEEYILDSGREIRWTWV